MADLATAYLRLIPSLKGAEKSIERELGGIDASSSGRAMGAGLGEGIKGGLGKIAIGNFLGNMLTQGVNMAANAAADVFSSAFQNYADFEQLEGGIETLFGSTAEQAMQNAQNAFKTAGLSANEYMETVTGFAASLKQSLGDESAWQLASYADQAVQDMADNANKMGTDMASIQNAYQGFAKQNYTMLDNLKLGYGGTKEEMQRLLRDAEKLEGLDAGSLSESNFADVVTAIHAVQENLEITGTTAAEAGSTISGAMAAAKSAWQNLLTEVGKPDGDISARLEEFVSSVGTVLQNAIPVAQRVLAGMGDAIGNLASQAASYFMEHQTEIYDKVGELVQGAVTALMQALPYIIAGIGYLIGSALAYIVTHIPQIAETAVMLVGEFFASLLGMKPEGDKTVGELIGSMLTSIGGFFDDMFEAGANLVQGFIDGILSMPGRVADAIGATVGGAIDEGKRMLGIASPSKVFREIGSYTMLGLEAGINDELPTVSHAMDRVSGVLTAQSDASSAKGRMLSSGMEVAGGDAGGTGPRCLNIILELDGVQFARAVYRANNDETQRVGVKLAGGYA